MKNLVNFALMQAAWAACVLGAARGLYWLGPAAAAVILLVHFAFVADDRRAELRLVAAAALCGPLVDAALSWCGVFRFAGGGAWGVWAPGWIVALWAVFATTVPHALAWLDGRWALQIVFAAVGAPLSYIAGAGLGALAMPLGPELSAAAIAVGWGAAFPGLFWLRRRLASAP